MMLSEKITNHFLCVCVCVRVSNRNISAGWLQYQNKI